VDDQRLDQLSRRIAAFRTRRQALKAVAGAVVTLVAGTRAVAAQACTPQYGPCTADGACCAGAVCEHGLCMPGCRIDGAFTSAHMSPPGDSCRQCLPEVSTTSWTPANEGMSCWSGDPNAGITTCQNGTCIGSGPVDCRPLTVCHTAAFNSATGQCEQRFAESGTPCGGMEMCHGEFYTPADACDGNGFCIGGGSKTVGCAPYRCGGHRCTTSCLTDTDCAVGALCEAGLCLFPRELGERCDADWQCRSDYCVDGVCCDDRCDSLCATCSAETGGNCTRFVCDNDLSCTAGFCNEATGMCDYTVAPETCLIDGKCYDAGEPNLNDACQYCDPVRDVDEWSTCDHTAFCVNGACVTSVTGEITANDPQGVCNSSSDHFALHTIRHAGGRVNLRARPAGSSLAPRLGLYSAFDPANPCANRESTYIGFCGSDGEVIGTSNLAAGIYTVVVGGRASTFGAYALSIQSDSSCL